MTVNRWKNGLLLLVLLTAGAAFLAGCARLKILIGTPREEPLREVVLEGKGHGKVLLIPVTGFLSDVPKNGLFGQHPSMVQEVVSRLRRAEKDKEVKAVLFEINCPGGAVTASDILYHEIMDFKARTGAVVVAVLMDIATSGGYYTALPADRIVAHPTTITGSIGVVILRPALAGLMDKLGITVEVSKSGADKDMGSPFRPPTAQEQAMFQALTDRLGSRFLDLVARHRKAGPDELRKVASARIYLADEALALGLVDRLGYVNDAISEARTLAGLPADAKVVSYRRARYPDDTVYNTSLSNSRDAIAPLAGTGLPEVIPPLHPGFYYLWLPGGALAGK
jgi:protease-4